MPSHTTARRILAPVALGVAALLISGCGSSSATKRTVIQTVTAGPSTGNSAPSTGAQVTVPGVGSNSSVAPTDVSSSSGVPSTTRPVPSSSAPSGSVPSVSVSSGSSRSSSVPSVSQPSVSSPAPTSGPIQTVNPLTIDCPRILTVGDVKRVLGKEISSTTSRTKYGAEATVLSTGAVRCAYGLVNGQQKASLRVTQYKTVAAADAQIAVTVSSEKGLGATASDTTVGGQQAHVLLRSGGLINLRYGTWVLAVAVTNGQLGGNQAAQMTSLADLVLKRILTAAG